MSESSIRAQLSDARRFWEPRRLAYNLVLAAIVIGHFALAWPRSRAVFALRPLGLLLVLVGLANLGYSAAYLVEIATRRWLPRAGSRRWRHALWMGGTLLAAALTWYWLADEIVPSLVVT